VIVRLARADELDTGIFRVSSAALAGAPTNRREADRARPPAAQTRLEGRGATYLLSKPVNVLGRGADTDVRIDDPGISRRHAEVLLHADGRASVRDLGSTNGTFVDEQTVREIELHDGDTLRVGTTALVYRRGED
jgi:pSer/pThr/pTyr-binding forkhead associated (FHA) protein